MALGSALDHNLQGPEMNTTNKNGRETMSSVPQGGSKDGLGKKLGLRAG